MEVWEEIETLQSNRKRRKNNLCSLEDILKINKVKLKENLSDHKFKYELGLSVFNLIRGPLMVITTINTFIIILKPSSSIIVIIYVLLFLFSTFGIYFLGDLFDKFKMYLYFTKAYFKRSENQKQLESVLEKMMEEIKDVRKTLEKIPE